MLPRRHPLLLCSPWPRYATQFIWRSVKATMATVGHRIPLNPYHAAVPHWTPLTPLDSLNQSVEFHLPEGTKECVSELPPTPDLTDLSSPIMRASVS